ncbi:VENN motif pre-toxin domain-containing protein [Cedecea colo]|uniref:VENN motif-containing domain-containing protein n=1 Tax=Cedecea colo TaxID=2552946 RepID=A0ABX0VM10_9ENTR|nr:VENN motif pre-toxin domain-containing protein [Cedecea colo]NIY48081.1 hypothetical protein [Cedecea colo]
MIYQNAYADAMKAASHGTGSRTQQAIQAVTAAVQGVAGGNLNAAIAGAAAPYMAEVIGHQSGLEGMIKLATHAVANAVLASMQGQNALAGAAIGQLAGMIALEMYGKQASELSETERQTVSSLATLVAGITGALAPGRGVWQNVGIAAGGAIFSDGPDIGSAGSSAAGAWAGGKFGEYAPGIVYSITGKELPEFIYDIGGAFVSETATEVRKNITQK